MSDLDRPALEELATGPHPDPGALVDLGWLCLDEDRDPEAAEALARRALEAAVDAEDLADACELWSATTYPDGLAAISPQIAVRLGEDHPLTAQARGQVLFYAGDFASALPQLERAATDDGCGLSSYLLGCTLERLDRLPEADAVLEQASGLDPAYPSPTRVEDVWLDAVIQRALEALPAEISDELERAAVVLAEDYPSAARVAEGADPFLLGECLGETVDHTMGLGAPARIVVYRRNLERTCVDRDELEDEVRVTLYHEIGHALGLDEDGVAALGLA